MSERHIEARASEFERAALILGALTLLAVTGDLFQVPAWYMAIPNAISDGITIVFLVAYARLAILPDDEGDR